FRLGESAAFQLVDDLPLGLLVLVFVELVAALQRQGGGDIRHLVPRDVVGVHEPDVADVRAPALLDVHDEAHAAGVVADLVDAGQDGSSLERRRGGRASAERQRQEGQDPAQGEKIPATTICAMKDAPAAYAD